MLVMATDRGICGLAFAADTGEAAALEDMSSRWPEAQFIADDRAIEGHAANLLSQTDPTHLHLIGAPFQIKVWEALMRIPTGHVTTYSDIARTRSASNKKKLSNINAHPRHRRQGYTARCARSGRQSAATLSVG